MIDTHVVLHDPRGLVEADLPLDRAPHEALVTAVLTWKDPDLDARDYEQIALQLTAHARALAADARPPRRRPAQERRPRSPRRSRPPRS